jgi:hypothetical protein
MSLLTFADVRPWARAIKAKVLAREMPPWGADPDVGEFRNARVLSKAELDTLVEWVDSGSPEGLGTPPEFPTFPEGWNGSMNRPPDRVLELPIEFTLPPSGVIPTFTVWSQLPFDEDQFVEAIEMRAICRLEPTSDSGRCGKEARSASASRCPMTTIPSER